MNAATASAARVTAPRRHVDAIVHEFAAQQHGIVTRGQLRSAGVSADVVDHRVKARALRPVHAGVYAVGPIVARHAREMAAVLACPGGAASHASAAALLEMAVTPDEADRVHVTVPPDRHPGRRPGICAHRSRLADDEITRVEGIPVTTAARTILDLGSIVGARELERLLAQSERAGTLRLSDLTALLDRYAARPGTRSLRRILAAETAPAFTRSDAEERLLALIRDSGLPAPEMNARIHGMEVDCYWRRARLVVEVDGFAYHASARAFVRDRQRDTVLAAAGIQVLRLSWQQIVHDSRRTLVQLAQTLVRAER